jgi:hypothetical protein
MTGKASYLFLAHTNSQVRAELKSRLDKAYGAERHNQLYFSCIVAVSLLVEKTGGNR